MKWLSNSLRRLIRALACQARLAFVGFALVALFAGCATPRPSSADPKSLNTFNWSSVLPADLRRVAFLPITCEARTQEDTEGRDSLEPIVRAELVKTKRFEVVSITPELLEKCSGQAAWSDSELLPGDLLDWLRKSCACDAVLFCRLTVFQAYPPMTMGWRMRLVDLRTRNTLWAVDQVFDTRPGTPCWRNDVSQWLGFDCPGNSTDEWLLRNSPSRFGQVAVAKVFSTLPDP